MIDFYNNLIFQYRRIHSHEEMATQSKSPPQGSKYEQMMSTNRVVHRTLNLVLLAKEGEVKDERVDARAKELLQDFNEVVCYYYIYK